MPNPYPLEAFDAMHYSVCVCNPKGEIASYLGFSGGDIAIARAMYRAAVVCNPTDWIVLRRGMMVIEETGARV